MSTTQSDGGPKVLVIEDIRTFRFPATYARTIYAAWLPLLTEHWDEVWFDYDLGLTEDSDNTYVIAVEMERRAREGVPVDVDVVVVHSANPVGAARLVAALSPWYDTRRVDANHYLAPGSPEMYWTGGDDH